MLAFLFLFVFFPQVACRFHNVSHLARGALFVVDASVGETSKTAVGIEEDLFRPVILERPLRITDDGFNAFNFLGSRINNAKSDFPIRERSSHDIHIAGSWRGIFEDELFHADLLEAGDERLVISGKKHLLGTAPVAAADVKANSQSLHSFDDPVQKLRCIFQFRTRIPAGRESGSHECPPLIFLRKDNFGENGLVKLHKLASFGSQIHEFLPKDSYHVISHFLLVAISL